jgi:hypothetical protein
VSEWKSVLNTARIRDMKMRKPKRIRSEAERTLSALIVMLSVIVFGPWVVGIAALAGLTWLVVHFAG